jgi:hypothetical protein
MAVINAHFALFSRLAKGQIKKNSKAKTMNSSELKIIMVLSKVVIAGVGGIRIKKSDLKRFEKQVSKTIKSLPGLSKKAKIDFPNDSTILVNGKALLGQDFYKFQILFNDYEIKSGPYRKILIDKDQIWIGDFKDRNFFGTACGFNVKKVWPMNG